MLVLDINPGSAKALGQRKGYRPKMYQRLLVLLKTEAYEVLKLFELKIETFNIKNLVCTGKVYRDMKVQE
jgi:hypothetical protein